ncbi:MAG: hypothetical protein ACRDJN_07075, partial [Chloroflexota bacterium]
VAMLGKLAEIISDAEGEIICKIEREAADPEFELYSIRGGKLFRQRGRIIWAESEEVVANRKAHQVA